MKKIIKYIIKTFAKYIILLSSKINAGRYFTDELTKNILFKRQAVKHKELKFQFFIPNRINYMRVDTFSTKEPETLRWIDTFKKKNTFWDIGANIGLYSCYAVKRAESQVYAFEPSVFNLELLAKNVYLNSLSNKIIIIPFPLTDNLNLKPFNMSSTEWGGALSTFGQNIGHNGLSMSRVFDHKTIGMSIDNCVALLNFDKPNYLKIDVDGIEHLILKGASETLKNVESVLVEVNDNYKKQAKEIEKNLIQAGFKLKKKYSNNNEKSEVFSSYHNQIWVR